MAPHPHYGGVPKKRKARYSMTKIKAAFADPARLNRTMSAAEGADDLGIDEQEVTDVIANLTAGDFDKSMRSTVDRKTWQDVYKPTIGRRELYLKFTLDSRGEFLLISFKGNP